MISTARLALFLAGKPMTTLISAEKFKDHIVLTVKVDEFTGSKEVPVNSDLKTEAEGLVGEIMDAYYPKPLPPPEKPVMLDVSKIVLDVKPMEEEYEDRKALTDAAAQERVDKADNE